MSSPKQPNLDTVTTINEDGSRYFLHPADVRGWFTGARRWTGFILLAIYASLPWIPVNGYPAVFFDLANRQFHFFGLTFLSADLWLGFFLITGLGFGLFYITALLGRLWCGWTCPHTVFLEHVYRRIERFIDGPSQARKKLDGAPWNAGKIIRRVIKHSLYVLVSLAIAHIFVSYFVSIPRLYQFMQQSPLDNAKTFGVMLFLTVCLYGSFAWFREQFCIILCPYGRIQSALTDDDTVVIGYDSDRGEPRGKASDPDAGDCINCRRCVQVCPTGIDIRNGLQMECIGCAACIDACNEIMTKLDRPKGLVRYDSLNGLAGKKRRWIRPRILLYTSFLLLGVAFLGLALSNMRSIQFEITRMPGQPYYVTEDAVRNQFQVRLVSKRTRDSNLKVQIPSLPEGATYSTKDISIPLKALEEKDQTLIVTVPIENYTGRFHLKAEAVIEGDSKPIIDHLEFIGPSAYTLKKQKE